MLAKFRSGGFARVCGLGHFLPFFTRYAAHFKYDGIWLDLEHRAMDPREAQAIIKFATALGCTIDEVLAMSEHMAPWLGHLR